MWGVIVSYISSVDALGPGAPDQVEYDNQLSVRLAPQNTYTQYQHSIAHIYSRGRHTQYFFPQI